MSTFERVQKIICEQLEIDSHLVTEDASISGDLGADSLDLVDLSMSIEEEFNLEVPDDVLDLSELSVISLSSLTITSNQ